MTKKNDIVVQDAGQPLANRSRSQDVAEINEDGAIPMEPTRPAPSQVYQVREYRRRRRWGAPLTFLLLVLLPTVLAGYYYFKVATPQYVSAMQFGVRSADAARNDATPIFNGMAAASQIGLDSYMILEFVKSREMVDYLSSKMDFDKLFKGDHIDQWSALPDAASIEQKVKYWQKHIKPFFDLTTGAIYVEVRTFKPEDSQKVAEMILERATRLVNDMSQQIRDDALRSAKQEVEAAEERLRKSLAAVQTFRDSASRINPEKEADSRLQAVQAMRSEITRAKAQLAVQKSYLSSKSPAVVATERQIKALSDELEQMQSQITNENAASSDPALSQDIGKFDALALEQKFAEQYYANTMTSLERAKLQAERQVSYLAVFVRPTLAGSSTYPDPIQSTLIAFAACLGLWVLGLILFTSIREK